MEDSTVKVVVVFFSTIFFVSVPNKKDIYDKA